MDKEEVEEEEEYQCIILIYLIYINVVVFREDKSHYDKVASDETGLVCYCSRDVNQQDGNCYQNGCYNQRDDQEGFEVSEERDDDDEECDDEKPDWNKEEGIILF
ncbi:MAG: hypothetical protein EZS28_022670 [Streblomastix strix]|uniref:Uncharacterized protein n=1 Tax=Streblomastix strix TaxID=222440 RepID=A0A5J4VHF4_9EUKA|nr:MAG: hypothetical protein EZS28_022670 [Streblomastix strix]